MRCTDTCFSVKYRISSLPAPQLTHETMLSGPSYPSDGETPERQLPCALPSLVTGRPCPRVLEMAETATLTILDTWGQEQFTSQHTPGPGGRTPHLAGPRAHAGAEEAGSVGSEGAGPGLPGAASGPASSKQWGPGLVPARAERGGRTVGRLGPIACHGNTHTELSCGSHTRGAPRLWFYEPELRYIRSQ